MKKIGIMSMQRIYNYGSFLQAYGLKHLIEDLDRDNQVVFVDYEPGEPLVRENSENVTGIKRILSKVKEYSDVDTSLSNKIKFMNHKRTYAKRFYPILDIGIRNEKTEDLDTLVIGSDEVFNCVQSNTNVGYSRDLFGHSNKSRKLISYAGSFGNTTLEKIEEYNIKDELISDFANFDGVSVRDKNSQEIVKKLGVANCFLNVDPVLAYDFMNLEKKIPSQRLYDEKYIIVYGYSGRLSDDENQVLKKYAKDKQLKILCFGGVQGCCDEFIDCNPFELLAYFRDAEFILSDTFHGSIFSIINRKPFVTLIRKSIGTSYGNEEKLGFLLDTFGLSSQKVYELSYKNLKACIDNKIDYDYVFSELEEQRNKTKKYLNLFV